MADRGCGGDLFGRCARAGYAAVMHPGKYLGAAIALGLAASMGPTGGRGGYAREYLPPVKPRSNRKAALLEKALRRQAKGSE